MALSAITPDARHDQPTVATSRSVTFGFGSLKTPAPACAAPASTSADDLDGKEEAANAMALRLAQSQYSLFRSAPDRFPSYERLRFVRLPREWLGPGSPPVRYWPAIVYENLAELVRDLSPAESKILKARLILEHRKRPREVVARLLGWNGGLSSSPSRNAFEESKLELIRLSGSSIADNENGGGMSTDGDEELLSFDIDHQLDLEAACESVLQAAARKQRDAGGEEGTESSAVQCALRFLDALDMALNCIAMDVGSDPLPPRKRWMPSLETPANRAADGDEDDGSRFSAVDGERASGNETAVVAMKDNATKEEMIVVNNGRKADDEKKQKKSSKSEGGKRRRSQSSKSKAKLAALKAAAGSSNEKENRRNSAVLTAPRGLVEPKLKAVGDRNFGAGDKKKRKAPRSSGTHEANKKAPAPKDVIPSKAETCSRALDEEVHERSSSNASVMDFDVADQWKEVWLAMKKHGWTWRGGSGLMTDYYYIKPGRKLKDGLEGRDFFVRVEDAQAYAQTVYGWGTFAKCEDQLMANIEEHGTRYSGEVVPVITEGLEKDEAWSDVWKKMLRSGWNWRAGSGLMMGYYYIKPGCKIKGGEVGRDYFIELEDLQKFVRRNYGWIGGKEERDDRAVAAVNKAETGKQRRRSGGRSSGEHQAQEKRQKVERASLPAAKPASAPQPEESIEDVHDDDVSTKGGEDEDEEDLRSTFSESGFQSKKLFPEECADANVPSLVSGEGIGSDEPWKDVWDKMRKSGWTWKVGSGLMTDYYYIKPGCNVKGGTKGEDYFEREEDVRAFAVRNYGWRDDRARSKGDGGGDRKRRSLSSEGKSDAREQIGKRQKKISKQLQPTHERLKAKTPILSSLPPPPRNPFEKRVVWQALLQDGWRAISAGKYNKLHDWYYVRPKCDPGDESSKLGVDYFLSEEDAIKWSKTSSSQTIASSRSPPPKDPFEKRTRWQALLKDGWRVISAGKYNKLHDWYYVRPDCDPGDESSKLGVNYFLSEEDAIKWTNMSRQGSVAKPTPKLSKNQSGARKEKASSDGIFTPADCQTKPQDPAIPLLPSPDKSISGQDNDDFYEWANLWPTLQKAGWRCIKAAKYNPLHDWYFVRPNRDPGDNQCKLGKHFFTCPDDVINFVRLLDKNDCGGRKGKKKFRESNGVILGAFEEEA